MVLLSTKAFNASCIITKKITNKMHYID